MSQPHADDTTNEIVIWADRHGYWTASYGGVEWALGPLEQHEAVAYVSDPGFSVTVSVTVGPSVHGDRDIAAFHEAGHAVVGYYRGLTPTIATLIDWASQDGLVTYSKAADDPIVTLAGPAAQERYNPQSRGFKCEDDMRRAIAETDGNLGPFQARAEALVDQHWAAIERLAQALLTHATLEGPT